MASLLTQLTGGVETTGSVLDTMQDIIDTVANYGKEPVATTPIAAPTTPAAPVATASGGSSDGMLMVLVVVVLAVVLLR